jgi:16S rRNA (cytosine967-C5)-methyltransferase
VNKMGAEKLLRALREQVQLPSEAHVSQQVGSAVVVPRYTAVLNTSLHRDGLFEIQDEGSQLIAAFTLGSDEVFKVLAPEPAKLGSEAGYSPTEVRRPLTVIDACAGAGGKTLALADGMAGAGRVFGYDVSEKKIRALKQRAKRSHYRSIQSILLQEGEEESQLKKHFSSADKVLVDAPCSGIGILRRSPDIKWTGDEGGFDRLVSVQLRLLSLYGNLVKKGGSLVYSTCTFRKEETLDVVAAFLKGHPEFIREKGGFFGPFIGGADGFFMQEFRRQI